MIAICGSCVICFGVGFVASLVFVLPLVAWRNIRRSAEIASDVRG